MGDGAYGRHNAADPGSISNLKDLRCGGGHIGFERCVAVRFSAVMEAPGAGRRHVQILIKIVVTAIAGGLTYLLTNATDQPQIWQLTMSIFVAGIILVVQFLIESAEQSRHLIEDVHRISAAATHLATAEGHLGRGSLTRLIEAARRMDRQEELQLRFARNQVDDLASLLEGLGSGRAEHRGEDPDWLLGLTETAAE